MNLKPLISFVLFISMFTLIGCYTLVIHPKVLSDDSAKYYSIRVSDDCSSCHNSEYFRDNSISFPISTNNISLEQNSNYLDMDYHLRNNYFEYNSIPWWFNGSGGSSFKQRITVKPNTQNENNNETNLRNNDGSRNGQIRNSNDNSTPLPTRNETTNTNSNNSKPTETKSQTDDRNSNTGSQLRSNQGERGK